MDPVEPLGPAQLSPSAVPHRTAIEWLFAAMILSQALQYIFISRFGEPYPALMMPGFPGTPDSNGVIGTFVMKATILFEDNSVHWISTNELLFQIPLSRRRVIMAIMFGPRTKASAPPAFPTSLKERIKNSLFPGLVAKYARNAREHPDPQTTQWLRKRIRELCPTEDAKAVTFVSYNELYHTRSWPLERCRKVVGTNEVHLDDVR